MRGLNKTYALLIAIIIMGTISLYYVHGYISQKKASPKPLNTKQEITRLADKAKNNDGLSIAEQLDLAQYYQMNQENEKALHTYKDILKRDKNNVPAWHNLGNVYTKEKAFQKALNARKKALNLKPDAAHYYYLSENLLTSDPKLALKNIKKALSLTNNDDLSYAFYQTYTELLSHVVARQDFISYARLINSEAIHFPEIKIKLLENFKNELNPGSGEYNKAIELEQKIKHTKNKQD